MTAKIKQLNLFNHLSLLIIMLVGLLTSSLAIGADMSNNANNFYKSDAVTIKKLILKTNII